RRWALPSSRPAEPPPRQSPDLRDPRHVGPTLRRPRCARATPTRGAAPIPSSSAHDASLRPRPHHRDVEGGGGSRRRSEEDLIAPPILVAHREPRLPGNLG